ncbi:nucleotidyltransferase [Chryseobacterium sp. SNU WT5]|uniref:nucleotidyltransferase n=1 Tax=Chryseobacterium sp. SNU WT5 TaxID=2594269 RepID=UPI00117E6FDB|nr:nucleotidyltransferase [Chryseobacterium sp. SNU WT5]QDP85187.1 nucleotidyltransferase [Chryseobacterium sp. SNU WT5]
MARTITEIKKSITDRFMIDENLVNTYGLDNSKTFEDQFSLTAFENVLIDVFVFLFWTMEKLFDNHKTEVNGILSVLKPHTARWYRQKALSFQFGFDLYVDTDVFNNEGYSAEQIEKSKIIKYSAVTEAVNESRLIIKIATEDGNQELSPILVPQKESFDAYIDEIRDAGVKVTIINYLPDILRLNIKIYYDPLVLTASGVSILSGKKPVEIALKEYMKELPFDGELILSSLIDKLQKTEGVKIPHMINAASSWIDPTGTTYGNFENITVKKIPTSGYFKIENFNNIEYVV